MTLVSYGRGLALAHESRSTQWARLNQLAAVFEYDLAADGSPHSKNWEWR